MRSVAITRAWLRRLETSSPVPILVTRASAVRFTSAVLITTRRARLELATVSIVTGITITGTVPSRLDILIAEAITSAIWLQAVNVSHRASNVGWLIPTDVTCAFPSCIIAGTMIRTVIWAPALVALCTKEAALAIADTHRIVTFAVAIALIHTIGRASNREGLTSCAYIDVFTRAHSSFV